VDLALEATYPTKSEKLEIIREVRVRKVLTNCTIVDCTGNPPMKDMTVVIEGDRIVELMSGVYRPEAHEGDTQVIDLEGGYLLPGLWNVHTHLGDPFPDPKHLLRSETTLDRAIRAGSNAIDALRQGVTGIRTAGEPDYIDAAWKQAFDDNIFVGPRLFVCCKAISITGGHGYTGRMNAEVDGPYQVRKAVREQLKHGADHIKLMATGGHAEVIAGSGTYQESQLLMDEMAAAVEVAHQKGKRVCAHAGNPGMKTAIRAGVDCIEHGYHMDDEAIEMMVDNDVYYVPTLVCNLDEEWLRETGMIDLDAAGGNTRLAGRVLVAKSEAVTTEYAQAHREGFQKALKAGVKIACGGDSNPAGDFALLEIEHLVRAGMGEMEALIAATRTCADLCGVLDRLGTVEAGKLADLIVVSEDPLRNISNIRQLKLVLKGGQLVDTEAPDGSKDLCEVLFF
jgi:imidazolonepropionase-like amidohydrolase